ncbi:MAG: YggS family pyridoxal phosphate-dependent enzyme [Pseudomonadota bacterium]
MPPTEKNQHRLHDIKQKIAQAAHLIKRPPDDINLIAVSKTQDENSITPLLEAGHRIFGENRVQEAQKKWPQLKATYPGVELHLIGPLQSNKTKEAVALFDVIHTVDRSKIAKTIKDQMETQDKQLKLFIQVNTGEEPQKAGIATEQLDEFVEYCQHDLRLPIAGLMCIPPMEEEPALHFALLAKKASALGLKELSMGMSADYETAIQFGATYIRVGTALFGERGQR